MNSNTIKRKKKPYRYVLLKNSFKRLKDQGGPDDPLQRAVTKSEDQPKRMASQKEKGGAKTGAKDKFLKSLPKG